MMQMAKTWINLKCMRWCGVLIIINREIAIKSFDLDVHIGFTTFRSWDGASDIDCSLKNLSEYLLLDTIRNRAWD